MEQQCRLVIKEDGKWHIGLMVYKNIKDAEVRKQYLIQLGVKPENIKIITHSELFN